MRTCADKDGEAGALVNWGADGMTHEGQINTLSNPHMVRCQALVLKLHSLRDHGVYTEVFHCSPVCWSKRPENIQASLPGGSVAVTTVIIPALSGVCPSSQVLFPALHTHRAPRDQQPPQSGGRLEMQVPSVHPAAE